MLTAGRGEIFRALRAENIGVNVHYIPVHQHPYYRERLKSGGKSNSNSKESYPVAEDAYERLISLPMFHSMTAQDVEDATHALHKVLKHFEGEGGDAASRATAGVLEGRESE
jgi:perosamine synthetase